MKNNYYIIQTRNLQNNVTPNYNAINNSSTKSQPTKSTNKSSFEIEIENETQFIEEQQQTLQQQTQQQQKHQEQYCCLNYDAETVNKSCIYLLFS